MSRKNSAGILGCIVVVGAISLIGAIGNIVSTTLNPIVGAVCFVACILLIGAFLNKN